MKNLFKETKGAIAPVTLLLGVIAIVVIAAAVMMYSGTTTPGTVGPTVGAETGDITLSFTNMNGTSVGTMAGMTIYLTSAGVYEDYPDAYDAIDDEGGLVSPYDSSKVASAKSSTPTDGAVTFSVVGTKYDSTAPATYPGTDFGVVVLDSGTLGVSSYCPLAGTIKTTIHKNMDEDIVDQVIEGIDEYLGATIELEPRGNISVYDSLGASYDQSTYTRDTATNASETEKEFEIAVRLGSDKSKLYDVGTYVEELDDVQNSSAALTLNDVEVYVNGNKMSGVSLTKVADLESGSPEKKNAPSANTTGTSTMWYVEGGEFDIQRINANNLDEVVIKMIDYDVAFTGYGSDQADIKFHFVPFNAHEDSDLMTTSTFLFQIGDEETTTGFA